MIGTPTVNADAWTNPKAKTIAWIRYVRRKRILEAFSRRGGKEPAEKSDVKTRRRDFGLVLRLQAPSNVDEAAAGSGAVTDFKTMVLMSPDEGLDAMLLAPGAGYLPPRG